MVLVIGGTGLLGSRLSEKLLAEGERVRVMTRTPEKAAQLEKLGADVVAGDLRDAASVTRACRGATYVVAAAHALNGKGSNNPHTVDEAGNRHLIDAAREARVKHFVFVSALGAGPEHPLEFFRIKHKTERYLQGSGLSHTILRPTAFMEFWAQMIGQPILDKGKTTIFGPGVNPINFMSVEDVAHFALLALYNPEARNRILDIGGPENLSLLEVAAIFEREAGRKAKITHVPLGVMRVMGALLGPFNGGMSRIMAAGVHMNTSDQTFDAQSLLEEFPLQLTRLEDLARRAQGAKQEQNASAAAPTG